MNCRSPRRTRLVSPFVIVFSLILALAGSVTVSAQEQEKVPLKDITISGNVRVEDEGIRLHLKSRPGEPFDSATIEHDVKAIFRMGFFDDVKAELTPDGVLIYEVKEKPYVREVKIQGADQIGKEKVETALGITPRTILDRSKVSEGVEKVRKLYSDQGYVNVQAEYAVSVEGNNQAVVVLNIIEGTRLLIKKISFEGNKTFSESELKGLMATREEWLFSFINNRGVLDRDILTNDMANLGVHYSDHGYIDSKIGEPVILRGRDGLEIVIRIEEGPQYRVGKVEIGGDLIRDGQQMLNQVKLTSGQIFRGSRLREDIQTLSDMYSNKGFAFVQIDPVTNVNSTDKKVDIALVITKGPPVYFNRVLVAGNTKTRDKVVRRELHAAEQELYSGTKISQSRNALQRTGYFEDVQLTTKKTEQPDTVDLLVDVKEGPTGSFTIGAGYSSGDGFIFTTSVAEKNLFGLGQRLNGSFSLGSSRQDFIVSFLEPYAYDSQVAVGFDGFNTKREFDDFDQRKLGFGVNTSYPLKNMNFGWFGRRKPDTMKGSDELAVDSPPTIWDYMRAGLAYDLTHEKISGINPFAAQSIKDEQGSSLTSGVTPNLSYDSRDHFFNPTEGTKSDFSVKFAGLGGDSRFIKSDLSGKWYYPLLKDPNWGGAYVLGLGGSVGYGLGLAERASGEKDLPIFERYFLGGMNSVRGFAERSLGPTEPSCRKVRRNGVVVTNPDGTPKLTCHADVIGGDQAAVLNAEFMFPLIERYGLRGTAFFDMGQAFAASDGGFNFSDLRRSVGVGARWMSPFGPLRLELGFPLNKKSSDETSILGFSFGNPQ